VASSALARQHFGISGAVIFAAARSTPSRIGAREFDGDEWGLGFVIVIS
jgi:hypothetical protein